MTTQARVTREPDDRELLEALSDAIVRASVLVEAADQMRTDAVRRCQAAGHTWEQIGGVLGVTAQAARQRYYVKPQEPNNEETTAMQEQVTQLIEGPAHWLADVPRANGGKAGVFMIEYRDQPLFLGHARLAADEASESNKAQADGAYGRLVGVRRQPTRSIQRALEANFPGDIKSSAGTTLQKQTSVALVERARYRIVLTNNGAEAVRLYHFAQDWLGRHGHRPLADR